MQTQADIAALTHEQALAALERERRLRQLGVLAAETEEEKHQRLAADARTRGRLESGLRQAVLGEERRAEAVLSHEHRQAAQAQLDVLESESRGRSERLVEMERHLQRQEFQTALREHELSER